MFKYEKNRHYLMPVHFGPQPGFREPVEGFEPDHKTYPKRRTAFVHFLTRADQLERILPPGFSLWGEPVISFEISHHTEVEWLGGRGYGVCGINYPARYEGRKETVHGMFRSVTFENLPDVINSGREDLGCHKIYCEIPEPRVLKGNYYFICSLYGRTFFEMELSGLKELSAEGKVDDKPFVGRGEIDGIRNQGLLYYKYIPRINEPGVADVEHAVLLPSEYPNLTIEKVFVGKGAARFHKSTWQDLPKYYHVVNALAELELLEFRGASLTFSHGGKDLSDMRMIE